MKVQLSCRQWEELFSRVLIVFGDVPLSFIHPSHFSLFLGKNNSISAELNGLRFSFLI